MITWALTVIGMVYVITESSIFSPFRMHLTARLFGPAAYCASCVGFWVGVALYFWTGGVTPEAPLALTAALVNGFAASAVGTLWRTYAGNNLAYQYETAVLEEQRKLRESDKE